MALAIAVAEPRIPAGGPGGNTQDVAIAIRGDAGTQTLRATLDAPPPTPFVSTGFPFTEGTRLWSFEADASSVDLRYLFPIRGTYVFGVDETRADGTRAALTQRVSVAEDPRVLRALAIFVIVLLAVGAIAGYVLAGGLVPAALAPCIAALALVAALGSPAIVRAHDAGAPRGAGPKTGSLWPVIANVAGPATFEVEARNVEDGKPLLRAVLPSRDGRLRLRLQFYDGAPHELRIRAVRLGSVVREWKLPIDVEAQQPPLGRRLWALFAMLAIVGLGYAAGTFTRLRTAAAR